MHGPAGTGTGKKKKGQIKEEEKEDEEEEEEEEKECTTGVNIHASGWTRPTFKFPITVFRPG